MDELHGVNPLVKHDVNLNISGGRALNTHKQGVPANVTADENELVEYVQTERGASNIPDKYKGGDWAELEPFKNKFLFIETGGYFYITSKGQKIEFTNVDEDTIVLENKRTGEIVIIGANDTDITSDNSDTKLTILDSEINKIKMGRGNDTVNIENSKIDTIEGGSGNDKINIKNSVVTSSVNGGDNEDYISVVNSNVNTINGGAGDDEIMAEDSKIQKIDGGAGNDVINASSKNTIEEIFGGKGDDLINIANSTVTKLDGGKGKDSIKLEKSVVREIVGDKEDNIDYTTVEAPFSPYEALSPDAIQQASDITQNKTSKYSNKELTPEQEMQALAIDFFSQNLENMKSQLEAQESEDGALRDAYNWVKELIDIGVSKEDIKAALDEQSRMIAELTAALNGESGATFEEVFENWTGVKYSEENIQKYFETSQNYSLLASGLSRAENFKNKISNASSLGEVLECYTEYFGSEEEGRAKLNEMLQEAFLNPENSMAFGYPTSVEINENNELVVTRPKTYGAGGAMPGSEFETTTQDISDVTNMMNTMSWCFDLDKYSKVFKEKFETTTGKTIEQLQNEYKINQLNAFGGGNSFQKLIDRYCADQEGFADKLAGAAQIGGIGLMVVGGVVTFFCPPAGVAIMNAGKYTALAGMFGDNAIELIDDLASENGLSKDEAWDLMKESVTELALLYSGAKINGVATSVKDVVLTQTQSKALAFLSEIGTDVSLSLLTDFMITGEVDITGEGISQLLGIITGIAGAKVDAYTKEHFDAADKLYKSGDVDGALEYLKSKGIPKDIINKYCADLEADYVAMRQEIQTKLSEFDTSRAPEKVKYTDSYKNHTDNINKITSDFEKLSLDEIEAKMKDIGVSEQDLSELRRYNNPKESYAVISELISMGYNPGQACYLIGLTGLNAEGLARYCSLVDLGMDWLDAAQLIDEFGPNYCELTDARFEALRSLDKEGLSELKRITDDNFIHDIARYDTYNTILNGERLDTNLADRISEIGKKYGVDIKLDNDAVSKGYTGDIESSKVITDEQIRAVEEALEIMTQKNMRMPKHIYLTDFVDGDAVGGFNGMNPDTIVIRPDYPDPEFLKVSILHETSHMNDWVQTDTGGYYHSGWKGDLCGIGYNESLENMKPIQFKSGDYLSGADIANFIRQYATTNVREFVAEVNALLAAGAITKNPQGYWIIDKTKAPQEYCSGWSGTNALEYQKLDEIMWLYTYLTT